MTCTEGREPSGLAMVSLSRVLGDVRCYTGLALIGIRLWLSGARSADFDS
ncbi:hypothetical protein Pan14r_54440 [Crateriforma conspicua]|uniref:Uncharacterized protein n=1 Tax=Crateriforma conspicua TaxID=2527996 RepID=A0A5C5XTF6_9PLAN|nr:hypothetical protein Pan14r_54440 [Crateriforma conspicua]